MEDILRQNIEKDREIASLKAELDKLSQKSPVQPKLKRGLLANIKEAVTSPRRGTPGRTSRKTARTAHHWKAQQLDGVLKSWVTSVSLVTFLKMFFMF